MRLRRQSKCRRSAAGRQPGTICAPHHLIDAMQASEREKYDRQLAETVETRIDFIRCEIDAALTFLQLAKTEAIVNDLDGSRAALDKARIAYEEASKHLARVQEDKSEQTSSLQDQLNSLAAKLTAAQSLFG